MTDQKQVAVWKERPNRDEVLERAYAFIESISREAIDEACGHVLVDDPGQFQETLNKYLADFALGWLEDEELNQIEGGWLENLSDPATLQEAYINPEFDGNGFFLENGESFNIHISLLQRPTTIRAHFNVCEEDALFYLKFDKISTNPNLPALDHDD